MLLRLALRNIWRNRRRSLLTISAMVVSSSLLILTLGVYSGMMVDMLASATEQYYGHVVVTKAGYQDDREIFATFPPSPTLLETLAEQEGVLGVSPRMRAFGLISHDQSTYPVEMIGIVPEDEKGVTTLQDHLAAGRYISTDEKSGAIIGRGLAKKLGVSHGDELVFVTQAADGSIGNDLLTVTGVFGTGDTRQDNSLAMVNLPWLQSVMVLDGQIHEISLRLHDPLHAAAFADTLAPTLPEGMEVQDWGDLLPEMREAVASFEVGNLIMAVIIYLATGLGITNTFFMSVMERTREFGILMSLGMRPWRIRILVLGETVAMGAISLLAGCGLGFLMTLYMARIGIDLSSWLTPITYAGGTILPSLRAEIELDNFTMPAACLLITCILAAFFPANRAARLRPVEAIREE